MFIDARNLSAGETIDTEICIVGAGPAGITLAREFASKHRVCLLESGGLDFDKKTQSLCEGESVGNLFGSLNDQRRLQFGGTANSWKIKLGNNQRRWNDIDIRTIERTQDILKHEIARAGISQLEIERDTNLPKLIHAGTHHHMEHVCMMIPSKVLLIKIAKFMVFPTYL
jgi:choline dehydrogenase-like flavoprotein